MTPQKYLSKVHYQIQNQYQIKLEMSNNKVKVENYLLMYTYLRNKETQQMEIYFCEVICCFDKSKKYAKIRN